MADAMSALAPADSTIWKMLRELAEYEEEPLDRVVGFEEMWLWRLEKQVIKDADFQDRLGDLPICDVRLDWPDQRVEDRVTYYCPSCEAEYSTSFATPFQTRYSHRGYSLGDYVPCPVCGGLCQGE